MTTKLEQAARQALEALEQNTYYNFDDDIKVLREALAEQERKAKYDERFERLEKFEQAEQEPFAWMHPSGGCLSAHYMKEFATGLEKETHTIPLYASPVRTKDLTDDEIDRIACNVSHKEFARAVIAADREKNK